MAIDLSRDLVGNFKSQRSHFYPTLGLSQRNWGWDIENKMCLPAKVKPDGNLWLKFFSHDVMMIRLRKTMNHHSSRRNFWHGRSHNSELKTEGTKHTGTARRVINAAQIKLTITFPNKRIKSDSIPVSVMTVASSQNLYLDWPNTTFLSRCWQFLLTTNLIWKKGKFFWL